MKRNITNDKPQIENALEDFYRYFLKPLFIMFGSVALVMVGMVIYFFANGEI